MAGIFLLLLIAANLAGVRRPMPYAILGLLLWLAMMKSGVHATLAGVLAAFTVPASSSSDSATFSNSMANLISEFKEQAIVSRNVSRFNVLRNSKKQAILQSIENGVHKMASPLQRMEHGLHIWVSFLIVPIFALANAGIPIDFKNLGSLLLEPVTIGIMVGLFFGKAIGIFLSS